MTINSENVQNDGTITVRGTLCVGVAACRSPIRATRSAASRGLINASGRTQGGSIQFTGTGATSRLTSITMNVNGTCGTAARSTSKLPRFISPGPRSRPQRGAEQGGRIFLGESDPLRPTTLPSAQIVYISIGTSITANATSSGNGGQVGVLSVGTLGYFGSATANGAGLHGIPAPFPSSARPCPVQNPAQAPMADRAAARVARPWAAGGNGHGEARLEFADPDPGPNDAFGSPSPASSTVQPITRSSPVPATASAARARARLISSAIPTARCSAPCAVLMRAMRWAMLGAVVRRRTFGHRDAELEQQRRRDHVWKRHDRTTAGGGADLRQQQLDRASGDRIGSGGLGQLFSGNLAIRN